MTRRRAVAHGFTLVEMMVSLLLAAVLSLAVMGVLATAARSQRSTSAVNDINQSAAYAQVLLDKALRSAGSGFASADALFARQNPSGNAYGCQLNVSRSNTQILPRLSSDPLPAPFANVTTGTAGVFRLAPVVIAANQTTPGDSGNPSDVLIVMAGQAGEAESALLFQALSSANALTLQSTTGLAPSDTLLVVDQQPVASGIRPCMLTQVSSSWATSSTSAVALAGTYHASTINGNNLVDYTTQGAALHLGNPGDRTAPTFQLIGVGNSSTLYSYDLLKTGAADTVQPLAAGVFELHALYGLDTDGNGAVDTWASPTATGYTAAALMAGTAAAAATLRQIKALRVGLILRTNVTDGGQSAPASLTMFSDLGSTLTRTRDLEPAERKYRYRVVEATVPLRNPLLN